MRDAQHADDRSQPDAVDEGAEQGAGDTQGGGEHREHRGGGGVRVRPLLDQEEQREGLQREGQTRELAG